MDALRTLAAPSLGTVGNLLISIADDQIRGSAQYNTSMTAIWHSHAALWTNLAELASGVLQMGEVETYGAGCAAGRFVRINPALLVTNYSMPPSRCADFSVPYAAIPESAKSLSSVIIQTAVLAPFSFLLPTNTSHFISSGFVFHIHGNGSALEFGSLSSSDQITITAPIPDARECTGVFLDPSTLRWVTSGANCSTEGINDASLSKVAGKISLQAAGNGLFAAVQGPLAIIYTNAEARFSFRSCMVTANLNITQVAACENTLQSRATVDCSSLDADSCDFLKLQQLGEQKFLAAQEELNERNRNCVTTVCLLTNCDAYSCVACTDCKEQARGYYYLVKNQTLVTNQTVCDEDCKSQELDESIAKDRAVHASIETTMDDCMASTTTDTEREACVYDNARTELQAALGTEVDDILLNKYLYESAEGALKAELDDCMDTAVGQDGLDQCINVNGKQRLATSLGLAVSEVTMQLLNEFVDNAAIEAVGSSVQSCMAVATTGSQRTQCVSGDEAKQVLASSLGLLVENLGHGEIEEYVEEAAISRALDVVEACMDGIDLSLNASAASAARAACRDTTACNELAVRLGLLPSELTRARCYEYLDDASIKSVKSKMSSCVTAINATLSQDNQRTARLACKTIAAKTGLANMNGVNANEISSEELQTYILNAAINEKLPLTMASCISGIGTKNATDEAAARIACRTNSARAAYAESVGLLEADVDDEMVEEALDYAATATTRDAMKACTKLSNLTEQHTCIGSAKIKAATTMGWETISELHFAEFQMQAAYNEVRATAKACVQANAASCDLQAAYDSAAGTNSSTLLATSLGSAIAHEHKRSAARYLLKQNLKSCYESTSSTGEARSTAQIQACAKEMENGTFALLEDPSRIDKGIRDTIRELAAERMFACTQLGGNTAPCAAKAQGLMQAYSTDTISSASITDSLLIQRASLYTNALGTTGRVGCSSEDKSECKALAASSAKSYGGSPNASTIEIGFNALRAAAETWCSCEDVLGNGTAECEEQAKAQYSDLGGNPAEWDNDQKDSARDLANGVRAGAITTVLWSNSVDTTYEFAKPCSDLDTAAASNIVAAKVAEVDTALTASAISSPWSETSSTCVFKYRVYLSASTLTIDELTTALTAVTLTLTTSRRSSASANTNAGQTVSECSTVCEVDNPTAMPTGGPTGVPTSTESTSLTYSLAGMTASDFDETTLSGQTLRTSLVEAFVSVSGVSGSNVAIGSITDSRRSSALVTLVVSESIDADTVNAAMLDSGSAGFAQVFTAIAASYGQTINAPTLTVVGIDENSTDDDSDDFPVWAILVAVFGFVGIALVVFFACWWSRRKQQENATAAKDQAANNKVPSFKSPSAQLVEKGLAVITAPIEEDLKLDDVAVLNLDNAKQDYENRTTSSLVNELHELRRLQKQMATPHEDTHEFNYADAFEWQHTCTLVATSWHLSGVGVENQNDWSFGSPEEPQQL